MAIPVALAIWGLGALILEACSSQPEEKDSGGTPLDVPRYNPEPPKRPVIYDADEYLTDLKCTFPMESLAASQFNPHRLYGHCPTALSLHANTPFAEGEETLVTIQTDTEPPSVTYDILYPDIVTFDPDTPFSVSAFAYLTEIGPDLFAAAQISFSNASRPDELLLVDLHGKTRVEERPFLPVTLPDERTDTRGNAVLEFAPHNIRDLAFNPRNNKLYVATANLVCDADCTYEGSYFNPGTILEFTQGPDRTITQSVAMLTANYIPLRVAVAGRESNRLIVLNQGTSLVGTDSIDVFDTESAELLQSIPLEDFVQNNNETFTSINPLIAVHPKGDEVLFFAEGLDGLKYVNILDTDALTLTKFPQKLSSLLQLSLLPDASLLDGNGHMYLADGTFGYTSILTYKRSTQHLELHGVIAQDLSCFQYTSNADGYEVTRGGEPCADSFSGASLIYDGSLWRSVNNRIVRFSLADLP